MLKFEWDETKRRENIRKHGLDFVEAHSVFEMETYTQVDDRFDYGEVRYLTIGIANGRVLAITHTEEDGIVRIISIRKAQKHEQEIYFKEIRD